MSEDDIHETIAEIARAVVQAHGEATPGETAAAIADAICDHFAGDRPWFPSTEARFRQQRDQRIVEAVQQLGSCPPVAERFGLDRTRVWRIVKREGVQLRGRVDRLGGTGNAQSEPSPPDSDE